MSSPSLSVTRAFNGVGQRVRSATQTYGSGAPVDPSFAMAGGDPNTSAAAPAQEAPSAAAPAYNLRFPGQYYEYQTGYHYNWMRDYDPRTGRYLQADPIGLAGGLARYVYALANPMTYVDPTGLDTWGFSSGPATTSLVFSRLAGTLTANNQNGTTVGVFPAGNFTTRDSLGAWPTGSYAPSHYNRHPESGPNGAYGSNGIIVFDVPVEPVWACTPVEAGQTHRPSAAYERPMMLWVAS